MTESEQLSFLNEKEVSLYCVYKHIFPDGKVYVGETGLSHHTVLKWWDE